MTIIFEKHDGRADINWCRALYLNRWFVDAAAIAAKEIDRPNALLSSGMLRLDATSGKSFSVALNADVVSASVLLAKPARVASVPAEGYLEATESISDLRSLTPPRSAVALMSVAA